MSERLRFAVSIQDHARAARFVLATVRGDKVAAELVLREVAEGEVGASNALIFALADFGVQTLGMLPGDSSATLEAMLVRLLDADEQEPQQS